MLFSIWKEEHDVPVALTFRSCPRALRCLLVVGKKEDLYVSSNRTLCSHVLGKQFVMSPTGALCAQVLGCIFSWAGI